MNEIVNNFLLAEDKFMHEMHLRQLGFTYSTCGPFIKNKERIQRYAWVIPLKDKKGITSTNAFQKTLDDQTKYE